MMAALPLDLLHLLSDQLAQELDFPTLYSCVVSSKHFCNAGAVAALYRISHESPVKGGSSDMPSDLQYLITQKWSILWRTVILSAIGKTTYPYSRHLRFLDLNDLGSLLEDDSRFSGKISQFFFSGEMSRFHFTMRGIRGSILNRAKIISAIGDEITQKAPLLEGISEPMAYDIMSTALPTWIPRLAHLQRLDLFYGKPLLDEELRNLLHVHCPNLSILNIYNSSSTESDHALATFISGMPENKLVSFQNYGDCGIGAETCLAMNHHSRSLTHLKLALTGEGVLSLALLQGCTALRTLAVGSTHVSADLKATQNDVYLEIIEWLQNCTSLRDVSLFNIVSAPDLMLPVLLNKGIALEELEIHAGLMFEDAMYVMKDHHDFHQALTQQQTLRRLHLNANPDPPDRDDLETLLNCLCSLKGLHELRLDRISEYFTNEHIKLLAQHLSELRELTVGGYGISDSVFPSLLQLKQLKTINFMGVTMFTSKGITGFIDSLGPDNAGMVISIDAADPDTALESDEVELLRELVVAKVDGRLTYELLRDPNVPEYYGSDDSD